MVDKAESMKRLEEQVKRIYPVNTGDDSKPDPGHNNMVSSRQSDRRCPPTIYSAQTLAF